MTRICGWLAGLMLGGSIATAAEPPVPDVAALLRQLTSDEHAAREQAVIALTVMAKDSIAEIAAAAQSSDPELAWRAKETLQLICATVDLSQEQQVRNAIVRLSRSQHKGEAELGRTLLRQWPLFRHDYAAANLEALGAEIADVSREQMLQAEPAADAFPAIPLPGGIFGGFFGLLEGRFGVLKAALLTEESGDEVEEEELLEIDAEALEGIIADFGGFPGGLILGEGFFGGMGEPAMFGGRWAVTVAEVPAEDQLPPGTLRLGRGWIGGDRGLKYVAGLQQIHTVILQDASVTDDALTELGKIRSLTQLQVLGTRLSSAALAKFRQQHRNVTMTATGPAMLGVNTSEHSHGVLVQSVTPETGARRAGLAEQDVIEKIDGRQVRNASDVMIALYDKQPRDVVKIEYRRKGQRHSAAIELCSREHVLAHAPATPAVFHHPPNHPISGHHIWHSFDVADPFGP